MSPRPSDAARATLLRAIQIEARNAAVYESLAQLFEGLQDPVMAVFREMAAEERDHGAELERLYRQRFPPVSSPAAEPAEVIEAPDLEDSEALIFDSMTVEQALEIGLHAEEAAREFYRQELSRTSDPGLEKMYRELAEFEESHVRLLAEKLAAKRAAGDAAR